MTEQRRTREKVLSADSLVPPIAFVGFTVMALCLVAGVLALLTGSQEWVVVGAAMGDLGRLGLLEDAPWLFPTFIAVLFALAVVPPRLLDESDIEQAYRQKIVRLIPAVVGILAMVSMILMIIGVVYYPSAAPKLASPILVSIVTIGVAYVLTASLVRRPSYRVAVLRGQLEETSGAKQKTGTSHSSLMATDRNWRVLAKRIVFTFAVSVVVPSAILFLISLVKPPRAGAETIVSQITLFGILAFMALFFGCLISAQLWNSQRQRVDWVLLVVTYIVPAGTVLLFVAGHLTGAAPWLGALELLSVAIPTVLVWLPERQLPRFLRHISVHTALGAVVLRVLRERETRLRQDIQTLEDPEMTSPEDPAPTTPGADDTDEPDGSPSTTAAPTTTGLNTVGLVGFGALLAGVGITLAITGRHRRTDS